MPFALKTVHLDFGNPSVLPDVLRDLATVVQAVLARMGKPYPGSLPLDYASIDIQESTVSFSVCLETPPAADPPGDGEDMSLLTRRALCRPCVHLQTNVLKVLYWGPGASLPAAPEPEDLDPSLVRHLAAAILAHPEVQRPSGWKKSLEEKLLRTEPPPPPPLNATLVRYGFQPSMRLALGPARAGVFVHRRRLQFASQRVGDVLGKNYDAWDKRRSAVVARPYRTTDLMYDILAGGFIDPRPPEHRLMMIKTKKKKKHRASSLVAAEYGTDDNSDQDERNEVERATEEDKEVMKTKRPRSRVGLKRKINPKKQKTLSLVAAAYGS